MKPDPDCRAWFCVHTKAQQESYAEEHLRRQKVEVYLPRLRLRRVRRQKIEVVTPPLFPGYLFARFAYCGMHRAVASTRGVRRIVSFGGAPTPVDEEILREIRCHEDGEGLVNIPQPALRRGARVVITEGPFRGLEAIFEMELPGPQRIVILLHEIALRARVEMDRGWVRPA